MRSAILSTASLILVMGLIPGLAVAAEKDGGKHDDHHAKHHAKRLEKFDADRNGRLDESERAAARAARSAHMKEKHPKAFAKADRDGDGTLSKEEMKALREHRRDRHQQGDRGRKAD